MLELRPNCENCNVNLPPNSTKARICSYECTFCVVCAEGVLGNVCPNCGGGFAARPIRPSLNWKNNHSLVTNPASTKVIYKPVDIEAHAVFAEKIKLIKAEDR